MSKSTYTRSSIAASQRGEPDHRTATSALRGNDERFEFTSVPDLFAAEPSQKTGLLRHAKFVARALEMKLRSTQRLAVTLSHLDGETLLVTGGSDEQNLKAARWLCHRLRALGADAHMIERHTSDSERVVTWGSATSVCCVELDPSRNAA